MNPERALFARIGWMNNYRGITPEDPKLIGGGSYNRKHLGSEVGNFAPVKGRAYGYVQPPMISDSRIALERIDPTATDLNQLSHVLVVFVAKRPSGHQVIVGWYRNATVLRESESAPRRWKDDDASFNLRALAKDAVLLSPSRRVFRIDSGPGKMGQSNVCYSLTAEGRRKPGSWVDHAIAYVNDYDGPNFMTAPEEEVTKRLVENLDDIQSAMEGQGFPGNPKDKKAIEVFAMKRAKMFFRGHFASVRDASDRRAYDLFCEGPGKKPLCVEVKGTQGLGGTVFLTKNEVAMAKRGSALFILHSVKVKHGHATGGKPSIYWPWKLEEGKLTPIAFRYQCPKAK